MFATIGLGLTLFISTNVDDIVVLLGFFSDRRFKAKHIVVGQYVGLAMLVATSIVASLVSLVVPAQSVGLLGLLPIILGLRSLFRSKSEEADNFTTDRGGVGRVVSVALVVIANGGDNIGTYIPVFATRTASEVFLIVIVFAIMAAAWLAAASRLVAHPAVSGLVQRFGHVVVPYLLIIIGMMVLIKAGSFSLLV